MKKTLILLIAASMGAATMTSCKKTNKGKLSGTWTIDSFVQTENGSDTNTPTGGTASTSSNYSSMSFSDNVITMIQTYTSGGTTSGDTTTATINSASWTIEKDGTWSRVIDMTSTDAGTGWSMSNNYVMTESGTWSFVGKNKSAELKANDRVSFTTLSDASTSTTIVTVGGTAGDPEVETGLQTYTEGENVDVYIVSESKKKALTLTKETGGSNTDTDANGTDVRTDSSSSTWTLSQE